MQRKIVVVGEAWGVEEEKARRPFVGYTGSELTRMLHEAGINRQECFLTNVFNIHPKGNLLNEFCGSKSEALVGYPKLGNAGYVRDEYRDELDRLGREIEEISPNIIIAVGNTPMWALLGRNGISKFRGTTDYATALAPGRKVLSTYHPSAVVRDWPLRPTVVLDLAKAERESHFPEIRRPEREIWIEPTLEDLYEFERRYITEACILSTDIETSGTHITCIGFAPNSSVGIVIPFRNSRAKDRNYWPDVFSEAKAWEFVRNLLQRRRPGKLFQNGLYDVAFLYRAVGIRVMGAEEDTMLLHHALQPEALKGLGYLGSIYTDECAWKELRGSTKTIKRDE